MSTKQVAPKKFGVTIVENDKGALITSRVVIGWCMWIHFRKLNSVPWKDHFPFPFTSQFLEHVTRHPFYYFLDRYSDCYQIEIASKDQEKTTFTCPFGTYAFHRMHLVYVMH